MEKNELIEALRTARARGEQPQAPRGADLSGANLRSVDLSGADLRGADLRSVDLSGADLRGADLRGADLSGANLRVADLSGADLSGADLRGADLRSVTGGVLQVTGLHPYQAVMVPTAQGWRMQIGCWRGTVRELRDMIAKDYGWPEARGDQVAARRPLLAALADLCDLHAANHKEALDAVMKRWGNNKEN